MIVPLEPPSWMREVDESRPAVAFGCECARCGACGTWDTFMLEEGDEWECPTCFERLEALEGK